MANIYLLEAIKQDADERGENLRYDCNYGFVIIANCAAKARNLASCVAGYEGGNYWLDTGLSKIKKIGATRNIKEWVVLTDYNNA